MDQSHGRLNLSPGQCQPMVQCWPGPSRLKRHTVNSLDLGQAAGQEESEGDGGARHSEGESVQTEGPDELPLHRPGHRLDEGGGGQTRKHHVVQEHHVEVPQPVVAAKVSQEVEPRDPNCA